MRICEDMYKNISHPSNKKSYVPDKTFIFRVVPIVGTKHVRNIQAILYGKIPLPLSQWQHRHEKTINEYSMSRLS